ncbi:MAG: CPBP family intramembrane metalloprotease, partial [Phycisphaerales bacterium]|nr:CPBP family intramembrane metalloprotease [Phycisphaerales bacterium]
SPQGLLFPALWVLAIVAFVALWRDRTFDRVRLLNWRGCRREAPRILIQALVGCVLVGVVLWLVAPERLFSLPRERPGLWIAIMIGYPIASVYPQELVWRTAFFQRYEGTLGRIGCVVVSALAFGWVHIIFQNWIAVAMTVVGGVILGVKYARSRSTLAARLEQALLGCFVFMIGLGDFFYAGAVHRA